MILKGVRFNFTIVLLFVVLIFNSCKKRNAFNAEDGQNMVDVTSIRAHTDLVLFEANDLISSQFFLRGKFSSTEGLVSTTATSFCAMQVDTSLILSGKLFLNYSGNICDNLKREGQVVLTILDYPIKKWKDKSAVIKIEFNNYLVTSVNDNKSIKINGIEYISNESGGTFYELKYLNQPNLIHSITGNDFKVTFDKVHFLEYNVGRRITYTFKGSQISAASEGISSQDNFNNVDCWGLTRLEKNFTSRIEKAIVWNNGCTALKNISGESILKVNDTYFDLKAFYGTDGDGNPNTSSACANNWKITWSLRNKTKNRVFSY